MYKRFTFKNDMKPGTWSKNGYWEKHGYSKLIATINKTKKPLLKRLLLICDSAGTRTQGPYIKSVLLYQLSYEISLFDLGLQK
jgi:hypothetical protein